MRQLKILYNFFVLLIGVSVNAQYNITPHQVDSLKQLLSTAKEDTVKIDALFLMGIANQADHTSLAIQNFNEALRLARKINDENRILGCLVTIGFFYSNTGEPAKSIELLQEALRYAEAKKDDISMPLAFLANNYEAQGDLINAIYYARRSYQVYEKRLKDKLPTDERGYAAGPMRLGQLFEKMNQLDSAMHYAQLSYQRLSEKSSEASIYFYCIICNLLGNIHSRLNQPADAIHFYRLALNKAMEINYPSSIQESQAGLAGFYLKTNQPDSVIHYATQAYEGAKKIKGFSVMKEAAGLLRMVYEKQGVFDNALFYNDLAIAARDSVSGAEKVREVQNLTFREERRQEKILQDIAADRTAYKNSIRLYSMLGVLAGLALLATILYRNNRQKNKANVLLMEQKDEINKALTDLKSAQAQLIQSEKMASLGELTAGIAHEIQNPLNFVNNFSEINVELIEELKGEKGKNIAGQLEEETLMAIEENSKKILLHGKRAENIVRSMLEHSRTKPGEKINTDINALAEEYLKLSYHTIRARDKSFNVNIITDLHPAIPELKIIPADIGRVLINIFNNAFYSMNEKKKKLDSSYTPTLTIRSLIRDKSAVLIIKDTGLGIPKVVQSKIFQPFFTTKPTGNGTGLGLSLSYDIITKAHAGSITAESEEGEHCTIIISLPV